MAGETLWALGAALEPTVVEISLKRLCLDVRLLGTFIAALGLVAFVLRYAGLGAWLRASRFGAVCAAAVPLLLLAWTDPWHHLYLTVCRTRRSTVPRSPSGRSGPGSGRSSRTATPWPLSRRHLLAQA